MQWLFSLAWSESQFFKKNGSNISNQTHKILPEKLKKTLLGKDCSRIFIETQKKLELQSAIWSDYKEHKEVGFLVFVVPNSTITLSKVYTRRISDKTITLKPCFLDYYLGIVMTEMYSYHLRKKRASLRPEQ